MLTIFHSGMNLGRLMFASWGIAALGIATPALATQTTIPAKTEWNDSGVSVALGKKVIISASGTVVLCDGCAPSGPAGTPSKTTSEFNGGWAAPGLVPWSLVGKIGTSGVPFEIGADLTFIAGSSGELYLSVNDNYFPDNSGSWSATLEVKGGPIIILPGTRKWFGTTSAVSGITPSTSVGFDSNGDVAIVVSYKCSSCAPTAGLAPGVAIITQGQIDTLIPSLLYELKALGANLNSGTVKVTYSVASSKLIDISGIDSGLSLVSDFYTLDPNAELAELLNLDTNFEMFTIVGEVGEDICDYMNSTCSDIPADPISSLFQAEINTYVQAIDGLYSLSGRRWTEAYMYEVDQETLPNPYNVPNGDRVAAVMLQGDTFQITITGLSLQADQGSVLISPNLQFYPANQEGAGGVITIPPDPLNATTQVNLNFTGVEP